MKRDLTETDLLYLTDPQEWRSWLEQHYQTAKEIWLVYYKKHTGKPRISYNAAVEEALSSLDRRPAQPWSATVSFRRIRRPLR